MIVNKREQRPFGNNKFAICIMGVSIFYVSTKEFVVVLTSNNIIPE